MKNSQNVKIVVFVPEGHAKAVRQAMGDAGAGVIGKYTHCSNSAKVVGRFLPIAGANPFIGTVGVMEEVFEDRIEMVCPENIIQEVVSAMKIAHPYEEVAFDIYPLLDLE